MKKTILFFLFTIPFLAKAQVNASHNLVSDALARQWDEAIPLGNGMLGALVWQKQGKLRLSLDRADLWDERQALDLSKFNFGFVEQQVKKNDYDTVHALGDWPYDNIAYPTKLPCAALEFDLAGIGKIKNVSLDISTALCVIEFDNDIRINNYIHATNNTGYFAFENIGPVNPMPELVIPGYNDTAKQNNSNSHAGEGLGALGYAKGVVSKTGNSIRYRQPTYNGHYYEVLVQWKKFPNDNIVGQWTITNDRQATLPELVTTIEEPTGWPSHIKWWTDYWQQSSVSLPDKQLEKQYYLELYKLGCVARKAAPAITLQAIWTADNGSLPPWKGDFHHDLNTQLSYWPCYTGNHLRESATYIDWLWSIRNENKKFTRQYFSADGLNVPGVTTISGKAMGGWIQYSLSPSVSAWLLQHFYWQWKYSLDENFLRTRLYPYMHDVATFIEQVTYIKDGKRILPLSSSPEFNNNDIKAWFTEGYTNYDLSLYKLALTAGAEVATILHKNEEAKHWLELQAQLPALDVNETGLTVAPGANLTASHRHMSPYMAVYPLCLLNVDDTNQKKIIQNSLRQIEKMGTREWCGYSFSWMACLYARAKQVDSAVQQLKIFASNFCSTNSFHLNGDQKGGQYSNFTYRPFTLEGNFAFAQGVHELLLQSKQNYIEVFPAVPQNWKDVSFNSLRAEGAFLISAKKKNGAATEIKIVSEKGGVLRIKLPFKTWVVKKVSPASVRLSDEGITTVTMQKGQEVIFENGYE